VDDNDNDDDNDDDDDDDDDNDNDDDNDDDDDDSDDSDDSESEMINPTSDADLAMLNDVDSVAALPEDRLKAVSRKGKKRIAESKYFSEAPDTLVATEFSGMQLSRQLQRAVADLGWSRPTPIQARMVPVAMLGRDICANAVTGSGKTAAFSLPVLERLVHRPAGARAGVRCVVMLPTRELAAQCFDVVSKLARYVDVDVAVAAGGTSVKEEESTLRKLPDIVVATPGRFIDHLRNTRGFHVDDLEILILDEADRLLELGFADELQEIVRLCPKKRQTILTSATMTTAVERLTQLSLRNPIRLTVDPLLGVARSLTQEFIRVKDTNTLQREAILLALCTRTITERTIVFASRKLEVHRLRVLFGLCGLSVSELHGDMRQHERLESLELFRDGRVNFLIATDVAARGLDIAGVQNVINFSMPRNHKSYIHRVGRTARAERQGRAVSLIGQRDRPLLKQIVKLATSQVLQRVVPGPTIKHWAGKIDAFADDIEAIFKMEKRERSLDAAEMELEKAKNLLAHKSEISARPARTWFQTASEKAATVEAARAVEDDNGEMDIERAKRLVANAEKKAAAANQADRDAAREKRPDKARRRALKAFSEDELEALMKRQRSAKKLFNTGKLAVGNKSNKLVKREKRRESDARRDGALGGDTTGALTFEAEMARLDERDRLHSQKKHRVNGQKGNKTFKSAKRYKRR
jgi:ATP-dependent RNA helicase DDX27